MKKILKVTGYSLLSAILIGIIFCGIACLTAPGPSANVAKKLNMNRFSAYLTISLYEKSGDINDLGLAAERCIDGKLYSETVTYTQKLIDDQNYAGYVNFRNKQYYAANPAGIDFYYDNFIEANNVYANLHLNGAGAALLERGVQYTEKRQGRYLPGNAVSLYIRALAERGETNTTEELNLYLERKFQSLKIFYEGKKSDDIGRVCVDGYTLAKYLNDTVGIALWNARFQESL